MTLASTDDAISSSDLSGKIGLEWSPSSDLLIYASLSKGFKSGGLSGGFSGSDLELRPSLTLAFSYQDEVFKEITNNPIFAADDYWLVDGCWALEWGRFEAALWVKNLTDEEYITEAFDQSVFLQGFRVYGMPRTWA